MARLVALAAMVAGASSLLTFSVDPWQQPLPMPNNTIASVGLRANAASVAAWLCLDSDHLAALAPECSVVGDQPPNTPEPLRTCVSVTPGCECIDWLPVAVDSTDGQWSLGSTDRRCAHIQFRPATAIADWSQAYFEPVTVTWELSVADYTPSATAVRAAADQLGLAANLLSACTVAAQEPVAVTLRSWGCRVQTTLVLHLFRVDF